MLTPTPEFNQESDFTLDKIRPLGYPIMGTAADWLEKLDFWNRVVGGIDWFILRIRLHSVQRRKR